MLILVYSVLLFVVLPSNKAARFDPSIGKWIEVYSGAPCNPDQHDFVFGAMGKGNRHIVANGNDHGLPFGTAICDYDSKWKCYIEWGGVKKPTSCNVLISENQTNKAIGEIQPEYQWITVDHFVNNRDKYTAVTQTWTDNPNVELFSPYTLNEEGVKDGTVGRYDYARTSAYHCSGGIVVDGIDKVFKGKILVTNAIGKRVLRLIGVNGETPLYTTPSYIYHEMIDNMASTFIEMTFTKKYEKETGKKVTFCISVKAGLTVEVSAGFNAGFSQGDTKFGINLEQSFSYSEEKFQIKRTDVTFDRKVQILPMKSYNISLIAYRNQMDIPFTAEELIYAPDNKTVMFRVERSGKFENVVTDSAIFTIEEQPVVMPM